MPVLIIGTSDLDRHFHTFGISICSNETIADFKFMFQSLVDGLAKLKETIQVERLVSDASIRNAFAQIFGNDKLYVLGSYASQRGEKFAFT